MRAERTVFIIGAGASEEVGLPIGSTLTEKIATGIELKDEGLGVSMRYAQVQHALERAGIWNDPILPVVRDLTDAMSMAFSIDTYLQTHMANSDLVMLAKIGIARAILESEEASFLKPAAKGSDLFSLQKVAPTWYVALAQQLFSGVEIDQVDKLFENVAFIVFNYDRCLERFLIQAISVYFRIPTEKAKGIVENARIVHPYGSLTLSGQEMNFGSRYQDLHAIASSIKVFSERIEDERFMNSIWFELEAAQNVIFLGFAFHEQNMQLLTPPRNGPKKPPLRRILATTYKISESDTAIIRADTANTLWGGIIRPRDDVDFITFNGTCSAMFSEYWRTIKTCLALSRRDKLASISLNLIPDIAKARLAIDGAHNVGLALYAIEGDVIKTLRHGAQELDPVLKFGDGTSEGLIAAPARPSHCLSLQRGVRNLPLVSAWAVDRGGYANAAIL